MHGGESFAEGGDQVRSSHHQSQQPFEKFRYRGCRGSRISRKLRARAQEGSESFKPFLNASSLPPPNYIERNREFETGKLRNEKDPKGFLGKRSRISSGVPHHLNSTVKKPRWSDWAPTGVGFYRDPEPVQKSTLSPYSSEQTSVRESYGENYGIQNSSARPTHNERFQGQSSHFKHSQNSSWSCRWTYAMDPKIDQITHGRLPYGLGHPQVHNWAAEQQGLVREIRHERYKKHRGTADFRYRKRNRHVWIRNSSHREQTAVDSGISHHGKQQPLARIPSSSTHEEERAVVQKSGPQYSEEHKMQISADQSTHHKPVITSTTTHDHKHKVVEKSKMPTATQQEQLVHKSGPPAGKEPDQRNSIVEKRSATTQVEFVAALDLGFSVQRKKEHSTGQKTGIESRQDGMYRRVVSSQKKCLAQEHAAGRKTSTQRGHQDVTSGKPGTQKKGLVHGSAAPSPKAQKSNASSLHDQARDSAGKSDVVNQPAVNQEAVPSIQIQPSPVHKSNALAHGQEHVIAQKSSGAPLRKEPRKTVTRQKATAAAAPHHEPPKGEKVDRHYKVTRQKPTAAAAAHQEPPKGEKAEQDYTQLRERNISAPKDHFLQIPVDSATPSCLDHGNVDQISSTPTQMEQGLVQNSGAEVNDDLDLVQNSTNIVEIPLLRLMELIFGEAGAPKFEEVLCQTCGDVGYRELLVYCRCCKSSAQHRYCMSGLVSMDEDDLTWVCDDCVGRFPELDSLNELQSGSGIKALLQKNSSSANNVTKNDVEDNEEASKDSSFKAMINGCEMDEGGCSNFSEDVSNHSSPTPSEGGSGSPFPQDEEDCMNGDVRFTKRRIRRRRLIIYESEEEKIDDDLTSSDKSKESQDHVIPSMSDTSPESSARPMIEPIWRGWFEICGHKYGMLLGHLSSKACLKVCEGAKLLEHVTRVEMLPRIDAWPKTFERSPPSDDSIGVYFFPENFYDEKIFDKLVNEINSRDLVLKVILDEIELLIFSSRLLQQNTRFCGKYYLWGAFRAKQKPASDHLNQSTAVDHRRRNPNPKACSVLEGEIKGSGEEGREKKSSCCDLGRREMRVERLSMK